MKRPRPSSIDHLPKWATFHKSSTNFNQGSSSCNKASKKYSFPTSETAQDRTTKSTTTRNTTRNTNNNSSAIFSSSIASSTTMNQRTRDGNNNNFSVVEQIQNEHKRQIQNEEGLLRTKAYQFTSTQIVNSAFDNTLRRHASDRIYMPLRSFMNQFQFQHGLDEVEEEKQSSNYEQKSTLLRKERDRGEGGTSKRYKLSKEELKEQIRRQINRERIKYNPTLLPVAIINVPPSILDRKAILRTLQNLFMSQCINNDANKNDRCTIHGDDESQYNPAVCVLSENRKIESRQVDLYFRSILNQCIQQENNPSLFVDLLKSSSSSTMDNIITWAQNTSKFNSILVFIESPERIPKQAFNAFISVVSSMRCVHGIPIGLCLFSFSKEFIQKELLSNDIDSSSLHGEVGFILNEFSFVNTRLIINDFLEKLYLNADRSLNLPIILSSEAIKSLLYEFDKNHGSAVMFLNQLKILLAHHFTTGGSFICLMNNKSFMELYGIHSEWFCIDSKARKRMISDLNAVNGDVDTAKKLNNLAKDSCNFFNHIQDLLEERMIVELVIKLVIVVQRKLPLQPCGGSSEGDIKVGFNIIEAFLSRSDQFKLLLEKTMDFIRTTSKSELIRLVGSFIDVTDAFLSANEKRQMFVESVDRESDVSPMKQARDILSFFDQCIVLIDCVTNDMEWDLREWIAEKVCLLLCFRQSQGDENSTLSPVIHFGRKESTKFDRNIISVGPRREMAMALSKPTANGLNTLDFTFDVKVAFNVFDSRLISLEEWFGRFSEQLTQVLKDNSNTTVKVERFAFSLYQLMFCGLVVRSRRKDNLFEKGALVWASTTTLG